jgi:hypothetical protein
MLGCVMTALALNGYFINRHKIDFWLFYNEGRAWLDGRGLYEGVQALNLNPPALTVLVFAPLALVPYRVAHALWLALSVVAVFASVRVIVRAAALSLNRTLLLVAVLFLMHGGFQTWALGQLTWPLLFYPVTKAWVAYREGRHRAAGAWLAPAIVAKPPLALLALMLPSSVWMTAGAISAGVSLMTVALTGPEVWVNWLRAGGQVNWLTRPFNASLWGMAARWQAGANVPMRMSDLAVASLVAVLVVGMIFWWHALNQSKPDHRFFCAGLFSVLLSPLGWGYYLPLVAGPAAAIWPRSALALIALLLTLPPIPGDARGMGPLLSSALFGAVLCAWIACTRSAAPSNPLAIPNQDSRYPVKPL